MLPPAQPDTLDYPNALVMTYKNQYHNPLKCPDCPEYRLSHIAKCRVERDGKMLGIPLPMFVCPSCGNKEPQIKREKFDAIVDGHLADMKEGDICTVSLMGEGKRFASFEPLAMKYDATDYYTIPGLSREWDDGYLTPVFFDKDVLLWYNNHPEYRVVLHSFSSGTIVKGDEPLLRDGFGINRSGKIFMWLGDLDEDFGSEEMLPHLRRFQASNIVSDHDVASKFYLSQIPSSPEEAFYESDNERKLFRAVDKLSETYRGRFRRPLIKVDVQALGDLYRPPIMELREQVFSAYLSLTKAIVEGVDKEALKSELEKSGAEAKTYKDLGSNKLLQFFLEHALHSKSADKLMGPLFVLYDLRLLHGHLSEGSFDGKYQSCKERLGLPAEASDLDVHKALVTALIVSVEAIANLLSPVTA